MEADPVEEEAPAARMGPVVPAASAAVPDPIWVGAWASAAVGDTDPRDPPDGAVAAAAACFRSSALPVR